MKVPSEVGFISNSLKKNYFLLEKGNDFERKLFKSISKAIQQLENNAFSGKQISKKLIPNEYKENNNIWKINLVDGWRLLYYLKDDKIIVVSIILEWLNHKKYEKRFKY